MKTFVLATIFMVALTAVQARVTGPVPLDGAARTLHAGPGAQTDPHISGSRVSYTNRTTTGSEVRVFDLETGTSTAVPNEGIFQDSISDISGDIVVFTRRITSSSTQLIAFVDLADPTLTVTELAPDHSVRRTAASVGGDTVAFQQFSTQSTSLSAICVARLSRPTEPAQCITDESRSHMAPDVSPDGLYVVFQSCITPNVGCDIYAALRNLDGPWMPIAITSTGGTGSNNLSPATDGTIVVYSSDAASPGDFDVYYEPVTLGRAAPATRLEFSDGVVGSDEENPHVSGSLISLERTMPGETNADLYVFDIATNTFHLVSATPDVDEHLNDIELAADGTVHVVWAHTDPLTSADGDNVYALSFSLTGPSYQVCPLFDTSRSFKAGRVAPLKIQLCDATGANLSDPSLVLTAIRLVQRDTSAATVVVPDSPGEANADGVFRYDAALAGYIFNLSTAGLASGTWELQFRVSGATAINAIAFDVR